MKNQHILPVTILSLFLFASCGNENKQAKEDPKENAPEVCTYTYDAAQTKLTWTAYKFTEKTGVKGTFDTVSIAAKPDGNSIPTLLTNATFTIPIASINTTNPDRDKKIQKFFFGSLKSTTLLTGKVSNVVGDDNEGSLNFMLTMNEMEVPVSMAYMLSGDTLILSGTMDVHNWNAQSGITTLNKECEVLHKGTDGKSALWPDVHLELRSVLKKTCE